MVVHEQRSMGLGPKIRSSTVALWLLVVASFSPESAAQGSERDRNEARERFHRGLQLFNQGDDAGALAEFERAYELVPLPLIQFNIGLVHAAMGRPVDAVEVLDRLLAAPAELDAQKLARARTVRSEQLAMIGELDVVSNVAGANIEVNGVVRGRTPLQRPLRVARGTHIVGAVAQGHLPLRKEVRVPSGGVTRVELNLDPADGRLAALELRVVPVGVEVRLEGRRLATTPLPAPLSLPPGRHRVELARPGYRSETREVELGPGAAGQLTVTLAVDSGALAQQGGTLVLDVSEPNASVWIDGSKANLTARLPHGPHEVRIERAGFLPFTREVNVPRGRSIAVRVELEPTPATRAAYVSRTTSQRTWGWVATGAGTAFVLGGAGFLVYNARADADATDHYESEARKHEAGGACERGTDKQTPACLERLRLALDDLDAVRAREKFGWIGVGVGVAAVGAGAYLLLSGDDPNRYEPGPDSDVFGASRLAPVLSLTANGGFLGVRGGF